MRRFAAAVETLAERARPAIRQVGEALNRISEDLRKLREPHERR